ncbi:MAG: TlpA family protein disulfide reductase [Lachnospiraceae bacterium]|nr:TlpA family protein disulfide reductase [Candidatus Merdinaster equi]
MRKNKVISRIIVSLGVCSLVAMTACGVTNAINGEPQKLNSSNGTTESEAAEGMTEPEVTPEEEKKGEIQTYDVLGAGGDNTTSGDNTGDIPAEEAPGVYVHDSDVKPLGGVSLLVCDDSTCVIVETDANGYADLTDYSGTYEVHVYDVPDGVEYDADYVYYYNQGDAMHIMLRYENDSPASGNSEESASNEGSDRASEISLSFSAKDRNGKTVTDSIFADYKYTIINNWEPWCGPCVGEMPDLEKIYEKYEPMGINMIGVYSTEQDVDSTIRQTGVTYMMLKENSSFEKVFSTGYVPNTIVVDSNGNLIYLDGLATGTLGFVNNPTDYETMLYNCIVIGSKSYKDWDNFLSQLL